MEDFPANSRIPSPRKAVEPPKTEERIVEKVVTGQVITRKPSLGKRFMNTFIAGEGRGVWHYILFEVLVPAAKDVITDAISQGAEKMIFGEAKSTSRRTGNRPGSSGSYVQYNRYSSPSSPLGRRDDGRPVSRQARASHNFDEIILATKGEAEEVIDRLFDLVSRYEQATVSDLYDLVGVQGNFTDEKWGWTDIRGAGVTRIRQGYLLDLPRPEAL